MKDISSSKNMLNKLLIEHGVKLDLVVTGIFDKSAMAVPESMTDGEVPTETVKRALARLKTKPDLIARALAAELDGGGRARRPGFSATRNGTLGRSPSKRTGSWRPSQIAPSSVNASRRYPW
ncbi:MAG: hypothetical protein LBR80_13345 [Deltaproteobacteria bacterium]|jgi:hypothetical protein|nr:hypothetical protein [Deltaproteobacteria bacterium]